MLKITAIGTDKKRADTISAAGMRFRAARKHRGKETHAMQTYESSPNMTGGARAHAATAPVRITHLSHGSKNGHAPLLAQIPDLTENDAESMVEEQPPTADSRLISQALASKLILGGGLLLVLAAVLPFAFGKKTEPKPFDSEASAWHASPAAQSSGPAWSGGQSAAAPAAVSNAPTSIVVPAWQRRGARLERQPSRLDGQQDGSPHRQSNLAAEHVGKHAAGRHDLAKQTVFSGSRPAAGGGGKPAQLAWRRRRGRAGRSSCQRCGR
jgi:hypothetical protein